METPENKKNKRSVLSKTILVIAFLLVAGISGFVYYKYFYVFGEGVKEGQLNYVVYKGYVFKTYEGLLIQEGFRAPKSGLGLVESEKFEFSISNKEVAERLMAAGERNVKLHYKEYKAAIPWRGYSKYVVDSIISIKENPAPPVSI